MLKKFLPAWGGASLAVVMVVGVASQVVTMVKSGLAYGYGLGFWGANGHDGIWHLALASEVAGHWPWEWQMPVAAGEGLRNYHVGFDLLLGMLSGLARIGVGRWYFQILPVVLSLGMGILAFKVVVAWTGRKRAGVWAAFFTLMGGSWGWMVSLVREGGWGGESIFWANQSVSFLINPPFALSVVMLLLGWWLMLKWKKWTGRRIGVLGLIFGGMMGVKAYGGVVVLVGLAVATLWSVVVKKEGIKGNKWAKLLGVTVVVAGLVFLPLNWSSSGLLVVAPFELLRMMVASPDRFYWPKMAEALQNYIWGGVWGKLVAAFALLTGIFWLGNWGTRVIGMGRVVKWVRRGKWGGFEAMVVGTLAAAMVIPLVVVQRGSAWNSVQFFYYGLVVMGLLAGVQMDEWMGKVRGWGGYVVAGLVVGLTVPTTVGAMRHYLPYRAPARLPDEEKAALEFLRRLPEGVVLTYPFDRVAAKEAEKNPPRPLYLYESTAYVAAYSGKRVYLEDEVNLEITGYDWRKRREKVERFFGEQDGGWARGFLETNKVKYIYLVGKQELGRGEEDLNLVKLWDKEGVRIYRVSENS